MISIMNFFLLFLLIALLRSNVRLRTWNTKAKRLLRLYEDFLSGKIHHFEFRAIVYKEGLDEVEKDMLRSLKREKI